VAGGFHLTARGIRKSFGGVEVLHGVDLDVAGGETLVLLGENGAGKSTLVKIVAGDYVPDEGTLRLGDEEVDALDPVSARELGVRMIFQEPTDAPTLSVAENVALGRWPSRHGVVRWRELVDQARAILAELGVAIDPAAEMSTLSIGERQVVEIARAVSDRARVLILDEPTAALSGPEVEHLFEFVGRLRERGVALIYITHRLDEVERIGDRVQILRDGQVALRGPVGDFSRTALVEAMVGRDLGEAARPSARAITGDEPPALRLTGAASRRAFRDVDLDVRAGEVLALYGKVGSGSAAVVESAFGMRPLAAGALELDGTVRRLRSPAEAISAGMGLVPGDRQREGAFPVRPVAENLCAPSWRRLATWGILRRSGEERAYRRWHDALGIRSRNDPDQPLVTLSGGNQQKVILGRWLEREARVLLLVEPTRGVDVGARHEIYEAIQHLGSQGVAVLMATSDADEVVRVADRAAVIARGRIVARLAFEEITTGRLIQAAGG